MPLYQRSFCGALIALWKNELFTKISEIFFIPPWGGFDTFEVVLGYEA
jgi:hypothetical protein